VGRDVVDVGGDLASQAGDANHVELVEVGAEDRQELECLEQGFARVLGLVQDAAVELEPAQFAIDEQGWIYRHTRGLRWRTATEEYLLGAASGPAGSPQQVLFRCCSYRFLYSSTRVSRIGPHRRSCCPDDARKYRGSSQIRARPAGSAARRLRHHST